MFSMKQINDLLKKYDIKPYRYTNSGKTTIIDTKIGRFAVKKKVHNDELFTYLKSRSFDYYPKIIGYDNNYEVVEYIDDTINYCHGSGGIAA